MTRSILLAGALLFASCSTPIAACAPACASGFHCDNGGCVSDGTVDASVGVDQAAACVPACNGLTPYCNAAHHCVGCVSDGQCALGSFCKIVSDASAACAPGCSGDDRCRPDGGAGGMACCANRCVDLSSSTADCGGCGKPCAVAHAQASCVASACQPGTCDKGWGDCNKDPKDGCEANLHVDAANCTACGMSCALAHAVSGCSDGCYIKACNFGWDDCNMNLADGCEAPVLADANNCGGCGKPCLGLPNAAAMCTAGNCVLGACNAGFEDCNKDPNDGCEVNLMQDKNNCSACGVVCANGLYCVKGVCQQGCLMGMGPPTACMTGIDPNDNVSKWIICSADCNGAWIAADTGGTYHAGHICANLGYTKVGKFGGTCGDVCGYCGGNLNNCMNLMANPMFDGGGNVGADMYGPILMMTVMWTCLP